MRRYFRWCLGLFLTPLLLLMALNLSVDPFGVYGVPTVDGLTAEKTRQHGTGMRIVKALRAADLAAEVLIVGTSRAEVAIDPYWTGFPGSAYNAALPDTNMLEQAAMVDFVLAEAPPKVLIFALDFLAFSDEYGVRHDFEWSPLSGKPVFETHAKLLLSRRATSLSLKTVSENVRGRVAKYDARGGLTGLTFDMERGHRGMFLTSLTPRSYARFRYSEDRFALFADTVERAKNAGVDVRLYISPIHAWTVEGFHALGLSDDFADWKRDLTQVADSLTLPLWDFSGYNSVTTEPVPEVKDLTRMMFFWENSHATRRVGNWVLERLFDQRTDAPADFGARLTAAKIEAHLAAQEMAGAAYRLSFPEESEAASRAVGRRF